MATKIEIELRRMADFGVHNGTCNFHIRHAQQEYYYDYYTCMNARFAHYQITGQNIATRINRTLVIMVPSKEPSVMALLNHNKSYMRLIFGLKRCTSLKAGE